MTGGHSSFKTLAYEIKLTGITGVLCCGNRFFKAITCVFTFVVISLAVSTLGSFAL